MITVILPVLAAAVLLLLASLLVPLGRRLRIPHAVLLAALGMVIGIAGIFVPEHSRFGVASDVFHGLTRLGMGPEAFLAVFLPPLLFTAGLIIDVRRLFDEAWAVLLLAVVAVFVTAAVAGIAVDWLTGLGIVASLLLGAIVATTDPAAVVAIFRDLGAPKRLTTLVQGESLLNDAAAIALFGVLTTILAGRAAPDLSLTAIDFLVDFVGGAVVGVVLAWLTLLVLPRLGGDTTAESTITLALAYLSYVLGSAYLDVSGVVAVVAAALTIAAYGPFRTTRHNWRALVETWSQIEFWASSLIFVLAAMLAARLVAELGVVDVLTIVTLVLAALLGRAVVLYGLLPTLVTLRLTRPVDRRFKGVILWGGLRGATTLVLALAVGDNRAIPAEVRGPIATAAVGFVFVTLFAQAPTLRSLLRILRLDQLDPIEGALRDRVRLLSRANARGRIATTVRQYGLDPSVEERAAARYGAETAAASVESADGLGDALSTDDQVRVGLLALTTREKELYLRHFEEYTVSRPILAMLATNADRLADRIRAEGVAAVDRMALETARGGRAFRRALWLHRRTGLSGPLARATESRFEALLIGRRVLRELIAYNRTALRPVFGSEIVNRIENRLNLRLQASDSALEALQLQFPEFADELATEYVERAALRFEAADYNDWVQESLISAEVYDHLRKGIERRRDEIARRPPLDLGLRLGDLMRRSSIFGGLAPAKARRIGRLLRPRLVVPGEFVIRKGTRPDGMYFVVSGGLEVRLPRRAVSIGPGSFVGEMGLLDRRPRSADVVAAGYSHLLFLDARDFRRLLSSDREIRSLIVAEADRRRADNQSFLRASRDGETPAAPAD